MATLGDMVDRIVDELNRPDLEAAVRSAIASAIQHYRGRRWWFNTSSVDGDPTVAGDDYVDYPAGLIALDQPRGGACGSLFVDTGSGVFDPLVKETAAVLESWGPAGNGTPYAYAEIGGQVRLYPPPAGAYALRWLGIVDLAELVDDTDANAWTTEAEAIIRQRAKAYVKIEYMNHAQAAAEQMQLALRPNCDGCLSTMELQALRALKLENTKRLARGSLRRSG